MVVIVRVDAEAEEAAEGAVLGPCEIIDVIFEPLVLLRVCDEAMLDEHLRAGCFDVVEAVVLRHVGCVVVGPSLRMTGELLEFVRDQMCEPPVDSEHGKANRVAACCRACSPVCVQEDGAVDLHTIVDPAGHRDPVEMGIAVEQANERTLNVGDELCLARRPCLRFVPGLQRPLVTRLDKNALHRDLPIELDSLARSYAGPATVTMTAAEA